MWLAFKLAVNDIVPVFHKKKYRSSWGDWKEKEKVMCNNAEQNKNNTETYTTMFSMGKLLDRGDYRYVHVIH